MPKMTPSEAFVETLVAQGVKNVFGIVGSAYMDALDLFPAAGIRFIPTVHEQGAGHMADGYSRVSGRHGVCIAQNGPGVTNFVTSTAAAYRAHSPWVVVTPGDRLRHHGARRLPGDGPAADLLQDHQVPGHVNVVRMAEITGRCFDMALAELGRRSSTSRATIFTARSTARSRARSALPAVPAPRRAWMRPPRS